GPGPHAGGERRRLAARRLRSGDGDRERALAGTLAERGSRSGRRLADRRGRDRGAERLLGVATGTHRPRHRRYVAPPDQPPRVPGAPRDRDRAPELAAGGARFPLYWGRARRHPRPREREPRVQLEARAGHRGRRGAGHGVRDDAAQARGPTGPGEHPLQQAAARADCAAQPGHREGERHTAPAGAADHRPAAEAVGDGAVRRAAVVALTLALGAQPALAQQVTLGPQFVLASYREVTSGLRYQGTGIGGALSARHHRFSAAAALSRVSFEPTSRSNATASFTASQVAAWLDYDVPTSPPRQPGHPP